MRLSSRNSADRHGNALGRTAVEEVDDTKLMQETKHSLFTDEQQAQIEHAHPYGFTNVPKKPTGQGSVRRAAEAFMSYMGAGRSHGVAVVVGDRRFRLHQLAEGEVAMYDDQGQQVHFKRSGLWASVPNSKQIVMQIMDDDQMPQDPKAQGGGANQPQKMGQIQQSGRNAQIKITLDKGKLQFDHPNGDVVFNCKTFKVNASVGAWLKGAINALVGNSNYLKATGANNVKGASNLYDPEWSPGAGDPPS